MESSPSNSTAQGTERRVRLAGWIVVLGFGLVHAWMYRYDIRDVDGISYLDMGEAYWRGDWSTALNAYWSPLYAWLLGLAVTVFRPTPLWEYPLTQVVNFSIYVGAFASFDLLLRQLGRSKPDAGIENDDRPAALPGWALLAIGYAVFVWSALYWQYFWLQSPDMLLAAWVFLAASLLLRIRDGSAGLRPFLLLGIVLGLGYLTKAAMFPLAFVFIATAAIGARIQPAAARGAASALVSFLLVAGPLVVALSVQKERFTFGDAGRLNYAWFVNGLAPVPDWQLWPHWRPSSRFGEPVHRLLEISPEPLALAFEGPVGGSYPPWYDPSFWHEGVQPRFELATQLKRLGKSARFLFDFVRDGPQPGLFVAATILLLIGGRGGIQRRDVLRCAVLIVPSLAAIGMYSLVWLEGRYIAPFVCLLWLSVFGGVRFATAGAADQAGAPAAIASSVLVFGLATVATVGDLTKAIEDPSHDARRHADLAHGVWAAGVRPGDAVAVVGSWLDAARWARLARVRIVAEVPREATEAFWGADVQTRAEVLTALCGTAANAVVAEHLARGTSTPGWRRLADGQAHGYLACPSQGRAVEGE